ncbi:hypothetical protein GCM10028812_22410 [Ancylobacter sonchi]|uniref:hypothetical protein n=1 Tax=Ancylobacter sonchi TaxID=1937790 RepID=UPI001FEC020A|nr:hypothetical protein [Ancylobacter sonchi]
MPFYPLTLAGRAAAPLRAGLVTGLLAALLIAAPIAEAASPAGGLWPCIQPRVDNLAAAQMWDGPPIDGLAWRDDAAVADLVPVLAARRTPIEEAGTRVEDFARQAGADKNKRLTLLFAGVFDQINGLRTRILTGIERYSKHQIGLSDRIRAESLEVAKLKKAASTDADKTKAADAEKQLLWDTRIYDTRAQAVNAVCESPVILEQRAFALARAIRAQMD